MAITLVENPNPIIQEKVDVESPNLIASFTVNGEPASKARPRFDGRGEKGKVFTPAKTHAAEQQVAKAYLEATHKRFTDEDALYRVEATFYCGTRQRRDVDNMLKLLLDGLNKWAWPDDSQVMEISGTKKFVSKDEARTEAKVFIIGRRTPRIKACPQCGKQFKVYPSSGKKIHFCSPECRWKQHNAEMASQKRFRECQYCHQKFRVKPSSEAKYCSVECRNEAGRIDVTCIVCGKTVRKRKSSKAQKYCSEACMKQDYRNRQKLLGIGAGQCEICGGPVSRKEYRRCQTCYWQSR